jgi:hypothetical protein
MDLATRYSPFLMDAFSSSADGAACFDDLVHAALGTGARVTDIATWLSDARRDGLVTSDGFQLLADGRVGPQRFSLTIDGLRLANEHRADRFIR